MYTIEIKQPGQPWYPIGTYQAWHTCLSTYDTLNRTMARIVRHGEVICTSKQPARPGYQGKDRRDYSKVHKEHCYQGEYSTTCKYGDDICPAKTD